MGDSLQGAQQARLLSNIHRHLLRVKSGLVASLQDPHYDQSNAAPERPKDLGVLAEVDPDKAADENSHRWDQERKRHFSLKRNL